MPAWASGWMEPNSIGGEVFYTLESILFKCHPGSRGMLALEKQ